MAHCFHAIQKSSLLLRFPVPLFFKQEQERTSVIGFHTFFYFKFFKARKSPPSILFPWSKAPASLSLHQAIVARLR